MSPVIGPSPLPGSPNKRSFVVQDADRIAHPVRPKTTFHNASPRRDIVGVTEKTFTDPTGFIDEVLLDDLRSSSGIRWYGSRGHGAWYLGWFWERGFFLVSGIVCFPLLEPGKARIRNGRLFMLRLVPSRFSPSGMAHRYVYAYSENVNEIFVGTRKPASVVSA